MKEKYETILKKITNTKALLVILLLGIGLMLLPGQDKKAAEKSTESPGISAISTTDYEKKLEKRLSEMLESIEGLSRVRVMITLEDNGEVYYAQDRASNEKDAGGTLSDRSTQSDEAFVLKNDSGGGQSPLVLKTKAPRISGVFVTLKGQESTQTVNDITGAVRAVLDVPAHRVKILFQS